MQDIVHKALQSRFWELARCLNERLGEKQPHCIGIHFDRGGPIKDDRQKAEPGLLRALSFRPRTFLLFQTIGFNRMPDHLEGAIKIEVDSALDGHIIEQAFLMGRYERF